MPKNYLNCDCMQLISRDIVSKYNDDKDTEVVVVRYDSEIAQVLDKRQIGLRTISTGLYTVDIRGY